MVRIVRWYHDGMTDRRFTLLSILIASGAAFSGYLSGTKFLTSTCAFNESCPYFWGYPACYFGFAMFAAMAVLAIQYKLRGITRPLFLKLIAGISLLGILFAGYFTLQELPALFTEGAAAFMLGLPTCAYGLLVCAAIFSISLTSLCKRPGTIR